MTFAEQREEGWREGKLVGASLISGFHQRPDKSTFIEITFCGGCPQNSWRNAWPLSSAGSLCPTRPPGGLTVKYRFCLLEVKSTLIFVYSIIPADFNSGRMSWIAMPPSLKKPHHGWFFQYLKSEGLRTLSNQEISGTRGRVWNARDAGEIWGRIFKCVGVGHAYAHTVVCNWLNVLWIQTKQKCLYRENCYF